MSNPGIAATLLEAVRDLDPTDRWKGAFPPAVGSEITARWLDGKTYKDTFVVANWGIVDDRYLDLFDEQDRSITLDANCLIDRWEYTRAQLAVFDAKRAASAEHYQQATGDIDPDHEARKTANPIYAHHASVVEEAIALAKLNADKPSAPASIDDLAASDFDDLAAQIREAAAEPAAPAAPAVVDLAKLRLLDSLKQEKAKVKARDKDLTAQIDALEEELVEQMVAADQATGLPFGDRKATVRVDTWPKRVDPENVTDTEYVQAFRDAGGEWADLVRNTVNSQTLRSMLAEWEEAHGPLPESLPESLQAVLTTTDTYKITFSNVAKTRVATRAARSKK